MRRRARVLGAAVSLLVVVSMPATGVAMTSPSAADRSMVAVDGAAAAGLRVAHTRTWSANPGDFNGDGAQDVLINYHGYFAGVRKRTQPGAKLWRNLGSGRYRHDLAIPFYSANREGRLIDRHNCDWADVDRNGRADLYCSTGRTEQNVVKHGRDNELWLQNRLGGFREVGTAWRAGDLCGRGRVVAFLRANRDRYPDLFVGNETPRPRPDVCNWSPLLPNEQSKLFVNVDGQRFRRAPRLWNYGGAQGTRCAEVLDFNEDGWSDLFTCSVEGRTPRLYENENGRGFDDVTPHSMLSMPLSDAVVADLDRDGDPDIVTAAFHRFGYYLNDDGEFGDHHLIARVTAPHQGWSVAVGDADGHGGPDVYGMVEGGLYHNPDDSIWLNDGLTFTRIPVPHAGGAADQVVALRPRRNGHTAFLVLNGRKRFRSGPVQLIRVIHR
jgi:hypothetical protein